jgi:pyruvate carboxylase subunit B
MKDSFKITVDKEVFTVEIDGEAVAVNGRNYNVDAVSMGAGNMSLLIDGTVSYAYVVSGFLHPSQHHVETGKPFQINVDSHIHDVVVDDQRSVLLKTLQKSQVRSTGPAEIIAPMPGLVAKILVSTGEGVKQGQGIIILEAMKMENEIRTTQAGSVNEILVQPGQAVEKGEILVKIGLESVKEA